MIPKNIYYCWFGRKELPDSVKRCIESWKTFCPDYTITEINESNYDVNSHPYTAWCYKHKKYAFVSDYVRIKTIFENGGIYLDTDVELLRSLDPLLSYQCYFGFEYKKAVTSGLGFGSEIGHPVLKTMLDIYDDLVADGKQPEAVICTKINTDAFRSYNLLLDGKTQFFDNGTLAVFAPDYFNPTKTDGVVNATENTYSVHWYDASWITPSMKIRRKLGNRFKDIFGDYFSVWLKKRLFFWKRY